MVAVALLSAASCLDAGARGFLIKAGVEFPNYNVSDLNKIKINAMTGWHAGIGYQTGTFSGFSFQPELLYQHTGLNISGEEQSDRVRTNNLQVTANVQWGVDLLIFRPFIFAAPFASYDLSALSEIANLKRWDYGIGVGLGFDIWKFQITGKYSWAFGGVVDWDSYKEQLGSIKANTGSFVLSLAFVF